MGSPIHEPSKASKDMRYLMAREKKDPRFAQLVARIRQAAAEFLAPATMLSGAAAVVAHELRRHDYASRQSAAFKASQHREDDAEAV
jgi:hypothetical protein